MARGGKVTDWESLGLLRFFLAFVVLAGHVNVFTTARGGWPGAVDLFGGKAAVVGFLLISGYSIGAALERSPEGFYRRRFLRIYPLYIVAIAFAALLQAVPYPSDLELPGIVGSDRGWGTALGNALLLQTFVVRPIAFNGPVWSLAIEAFFYALAPFFFRMRVGWLIALSLASMVFYELPRHDDWGFVYLALSKFNAAKYLWCWLLGFALRLHPSPLVLGISVLGSLHLVLGPYTPEPLSLATYLISLGAILAATRVRLPSSLRSVAAYLGDLSYPLYLFHFPVCLLLFIHFGIRSAGVFLAASMLVTVAALHGVDGFLKPRFFKPWLLPGS
jgi:peptidoglycan/LPS O-acetylase OafA/YrhL